MVSQNNISPTIILKINVTQIKSAETKTKTTMENFGEIKSAHERVNMLNEHPESSLESFYSGDPGEPVFLFFLLAVTLVADI